MLKLINIVNMLMKWLCKYDYFVNLNRMVRNTKLVNKLISFMIMYIVVMLFLAY